jgi:hypothetical protein
MVSNTDRLTTELNQVSLALKALVYKPDKIDNKNLSSEY